MQYWAVIDKERKGPMSLEELTNLALTPNTYVWRDGLTDWIKAKDLSELEGLFVNHTEPPEIPAIEVEDAPKADNCEQASNGTKAEPQNSEYNSWYPNSSVNGRPCPSTNLVFAIITLVCCCQLFSIIAIVYSSQVTSLYNRGEYEKSLKYSNYALYWSIASLVAAVVFFPFIWGFYFLEAFI
ncbi:MAG: CD225/dispanin family protein [Muribaculaceae bacterium]|nr:CD225/dispanin family protein [Muribaculaceae bacterium]